MVEFVTSGELCKSRDGDGWRWGVTSRALIFRRTRLSWELCVRNGRFAELNGRGGEGGPLYGVVDEYDSEHEATTVLLARRSQAQESSAAGPERTLNEAGFALNRGCRLLDRVCEPPSGLFALWRA